MNFQSKIKIIMSHISNWNFKNRNKLNAMRSTKKKKENKDSAYNNVKPKLEGFQS